MNLTEAQTLARQLMTEHGLLDGPRPWGFKFDTAVRRFGCCSWRHHHISLSRKLVGVNERDRVRDTILHEIAHAIAGAGAGHGPEWKAVCRRIGATPRACYSDKDTVIVAQRYQATCETCQKTHQWGRAPKAAYGCKATRACNPRTRLVVIDTQTGRQIETAPRLYRYPNVGTWTGLEAAAAQRREREAPRPVRRPNGLKGWNL